MKYLRQMLLIVFIITFLLLVQTNVSAQTSTAVTATIKISVCGNGIAEGGEDCDGSDFQSKTCQSLGFGGGTLGCDISCSFDTTTCIPLPTPIYTPTPTPQPTNAAVVSHTTSLHQAPLVNPSPRQAAKQLPKTILPVALQIFDLSNSGHLAQAALPAILKIWDNTWKSSVNQAELQKKGVKNNPMHLSCDVNNDGVCDIKDLSILLYYVGQ
ncbi:MAG TPA: hypothetical protein VN711_03615 [Candidatus Saccharimonadales bacterium]|nr:hypothetical protein [Candidatus Saccharimonadales bacterium]